MRTFTAEIKARGQLTIPKKIRVASYLEEGQIVSIIPVGDSVIITPKGLELECWSFILSLSCIKN